MNSPVQKIKESLGIEEVVSSYMKLEPAGSNLKAKCPFHNEKTPSFFVSPLRGSFYCFGCGASGDIFTFVEEFEGLDFKGALKLLADKAGIQLEAYSKGREETESEKEKLYRAMEEATLYFKNNLKETKEVLEYLKSRGLTDKSVEDFRIGFAMNDWRSLYGHLKNKGFTDSEIEKAGLIKNPLPASPEREGEFPSPLGREGRGYDRFRGRIMFPIADTSGRVIAFSGRLFVDDGKSAKYLNSPDTPIFKKSSILYGLDKAKQSIRKNDFSIVVEGQFDLILSHQAGFKNTVATSGTSLTGSDRSLDDTTNNLGMISHLSENIVFVFDGDKAGLAASERATPIGLALFKDMNVKAASLPLGVDPADLISRNGVDAWKEVIRNSKHIIEFLVDRYITDIQSKDSLKIKLNIEKKIIPYLELIQNPIKKSHFISMISNKSGVREDDIRDILNKSNKPDLIKESDTVEKSSNMFRKDYILRKLLGIILWQKTVKVPTPEGVGIPTASVGKQNTDVDAILKEIAEILNIKEDQVLKETEKNKEDLIFEAEVFYGGDANLEKDVAELLNNLREEFLKEELFKKMQELRVVEEKKDTDKTSEVLKQINEINNKIQDIKNKKI